MEPVPNLFVLEGSDGTGKSTQIQLLTQRLQQQGYDVVLFSFPRYSEQSSHFIKSYLAGQYGDSDVVGPYAASLFYALDRYEAMPSITAALAAGKIVLIDRYTASNLAHQGSKLQNAADRRGFYLWLDSLEHQILQLPRPTHSFVLYAPPAMTQQLLEKRHQEDDSQPDIHEADLPHLAAASAAYDELCALFPQDFERIDCVRNGQLLSKTEISDLLWNRLEPLLPSPESTHKEPYSEPAKTGPNTTQPDQIELELKEVSGLVVQKLILQNIKVEKKLSEPLSFIVPDEMPEELRAKYVETIQNLLDSYQSASNNNPVWLDTLPLATQYDCKISGNLQAIKQTIVELVAVPLIEMQNSGQKLFEQLFFYRNHGLSKGDVTIPLVTVDTSRKHKLALENTSSILNGSGFGDPGSPVNIVRVHPRNEVDILPDFLYGTTHDTYLELSGQVSRLPYAEKSKILKTIIRDRLPEELAKITYEVEVLSSLDSILGLKQLLSDAMDVVMQPVTPRYGFAMPDAIDHTEQADAYESMFDASLVLFSTIQPVQPEIAQYAVLQGHKARARLIFTANELSSLVAVAEESSLALQIVDSIRGIHPLLVESLTTSRP